MWADTAIMITLSRVTEPWNTCRELVIGCVPNRTAADQTLRQKHTAVRFLSFFKWTANAWKWNMYFVRFKMKRNSAQSWVFTLMLMLMLMLVSITALLHGSGTLALRSTQLLFTKRSCPYVCTQLLCSWRADAAELFTLLQNLLYCSLAVLQKKVTLLCYVLCVKHHRTSCSFVWFAWTLTGPQCIMGYHECMDTWACSCFTFHPPSAIWGLFFLRKNFSVSSVRMRLPELHLAVCWSVGIREAQMDQ